MTLGAAAIAACLACSVSFKISQPCSDDSECAEGLFCVSGRCARCPECGRGDASPSLADAAELPDAGLAEDAGAGADASLPPDADQSDAETFGLDAAEPGQDAAESGLDAGKPGVDAAAAGLDAAEPGLDAAAAGLDAAAPGLDASQSPPDAGMACATDPDCVNNYCSLGKCEADLTCSYQNVDLDGDGHVAKAAGGDDCDDGDPNVHPGASEGPAGDPSCSDGKDNDCDGLTDAADPGCQPCTTPADCADPDVCTAKSCTNSKCGFAAPPLLCPAYACSAVTSCGCKAGDGCYVVGGAGVCKTAGSKIPGDACAADNDCGRDATCYGICRQYCASDAECTGRSYAASYCQYWFATTLEPNLKVCTVPCEPITSAGCDPTWSCQILWGGARNLYLTDCDTAGAKAVGSACTANNECARSLVCYSNVCKRFCHMGGPASDCPGTFNSCQAVGSHAWIGGIEFGVCLLGQ